MTYEDERRWLIVALTVAALVQAATLGVLSVVLYRLLQFGGVLAVLLCLAMPASGATYAEAHAAALDGTPMLVLVVAAGCPPCARLKHDVSAVPTLTAGWSVVLFDASDPAARPHLISSSVPQLSLWKYDRTTKAWSRRTRVGYSGPGDLQAWRQP